ncbi:MAG: hypothetical protein ACFFCS_10115 [Candidatus Hodarchaeota archaeon]
MVDRIFEKSKDPYENNQQGSLNFSSLYTPWGFQKEVKPSSIFFSQHE